MKTLNLSGKTLDYAVAIALGYVPEFIKSYVTANKWYAWLHVPKAGRKPNEPEFRQLYSFNPTTDLAISGTVIELERICTEVDHSGIWIAYTLQEFGGERKYMQSGLTRSEAAMRCFVQIKSGSFVDIPNELDI